MNPLLKKQFKSKRFMELKLNCRKTIPILICSSKMKILLYSFLGFLMFSSLTTPASFNLTVNINGFTTNQGKSRIALYRSVDPFPETNGQFKAKIVSIENLKSSVTFENLSKGSYAIAVFHDKNSNGILDKNLLGIPTEKYGFSNNARETFSAPSFQSASISVDKTKIISIYIK